MPVVERFVSDIHSLVEALPLAMDSIGETRRECLEELDQYVTKYGQPIEDGGVVIPAKYVLGYRPLDRRATRAVDAEQLVPQSFVVMLVSLYDAYLGSLIECLLVEKTQLLTLSERTVTVGELLEFDDLGAVKRHLVEKEVESVLRQSHTEQFDWLERKFDIKLRQDLPAWPKFIELTERRNLFVHTGGRVSSQYLKVCKKHGVDCSGVQQAERLKVTPAYFREGYRTILEIGVKLSQVLWRKLYPEERGQADQQLSDISFMLLTEERYVLARTLLDFSTQVVKKHSSADARLRFVINRAQAYKWSGDGKRALEILNDEDLSAVSDEFKLAAAVLREDFTIAIALVRKLGLHGKVDLSGYREWPLFKEARERSDFQAVVAEVFGEPLCQTAVQVQSSIEPPSSKDPAEEESPVPIEGQGH